MNETTQKRQGNFLTRLVRKQIFIPLAALLLLIVFNLIADPSFFAITLKENSLGDLVLTGNLITILDNASELVILAIGMTLVTAASGGQDISVGSAIAIAGSVSRRARAPSIDRASNSWPQSMASGTTNTFCERISPVSMPASIFMIVIPVTFLPSRIARWIGAAPR